MVAYRDVLRGQMECTAVSNSIHYMLKCTYDNMVFCHSLCLKDKYFISTYILNNIVFKDVNPWIQYILEYSTINDIRAYKI